jgi:hypothetical protein
MQNRKKKMSNNKEKHFCKKISIMKFFCSIFSIFATRLHKIREKIYGGKIQNGAKF